MSWILQMYVEVGRDSLVTRCWSWLIWGVEQGLSIWPFFRRYCSMVVRLTVMQPSRVQIRTPTGSRLTLCQFLGGLSSGMTQYDGLASKRRQEVQKIHKILKIRKEKSMTPVYINVIHFSLRVLTLFNM
jgi:hypothetical protein